MSEYTEELSDRELDVLRCVARGASNKEVAVELSISENTVKVHLRRIFAKLEVSSRTEAARVAMQQGIIVIPGLEVESSVAAEPMVTVSDNEASTRLSETEPRPLPLAEERAPRRMATWGTVSLVLAILLTVAIVGIISLQLSGEGILPTPESFTNALIGEDWSVTNRPLPAAQADMAVVAAGLSIYGIGGETAEGVVDATYAFNAFEHTWRRLTPKPTAVTAASAAGLFGEIYVVGGRLADGQPTNVVEVYSPIQNAWRPVTALPQPVAGGLALSDGAFIYLFGGWNGSTYLDTTFVYDPGEDRWRPVTEMPQPMAYSTGQFMTGRLYVVGGFDGEQELAVCHFFNPNLEEWFACPNMLLARGKAGSAAVLNRLYVIGGGMNGRQEITFSERYDPATETWQVINSPLLAENPTWVGLGVANVENRIFVFGGRRGDELSLNTYIYAPFVYRTFLPNVPVGGGNN
jgi:DNA-binding CsgD family transcriptional regulator/N-acetylneuraminic acid mutarotase